MADQVEETQQNFMEFQREYVISQWPESPRLMDTDLERRERFLEALINQTFNDTPAQAAFAAGSALAQARIDAKNTRITELETALRLIERRADTSTINDTELDAIANIASSALIQETRGGNEV